MHSQITGSCAASPLHYPNVLNNRQAECCISHPTKFDITVSNDILTPGQSSSGQGLPKMSRNVLDVIPLIVLHGCLVGVRNEFDCWQKACRFRIVRRATMQLPDVSNYNVPRLQGLQSRVSPS